MRRPSTLAALVALAACSAEKDGAAPEPRVATETAPVSHSAALPTALQGRWGLVAADCEVGRADAKGLLTIDATTLKFYESLGRLTSLAEANGTAMRGTFAFTGEGMEWTRDQSIEVGDGGTMLVRMEHGADASPTPFQYIRCPA